MPQHKRITLPRVEDVIQRYDENHNTDARLDHLLRLLVLVDRTLVKHEHTDIARRLRQAFDELEDTA